MQKLGRQRDFGSERVFDKGLFDLEREYRRNDFELGVALDAERL